MLLKKVSPDRLSERKPNTLEKKLNRYLSRHTTYLTMLELVTKILRLGMLDLIIKNGN